MKRTQTRPQTHTAKDKQMSYRIPYYIGIHLKGRHHGITLPPICQSSFRS